MKKHLFSLLLLFVLLAALSPGVYAYPGGLLEGKPMNHNGGTTTAVTDNNGNTFVDGNKGVTYTFPYPAKITGYFTSIWRGEYTYSINLYNESGQLIYRSVNPSGGSDVIRNLPAPVEGVKTVMFGGGYGDSTFLYEFDVFGEMTGPDITPTDPVTDIIATPYEKEIQLSWTNPSQLDVKNIKIYRGVELIATIKTNTFKDTNLNPSTTYRYLFVVEDMAGNLSQESSIELNTLDPPPPPPPPPPPGNLSIKADQVTHESVKLSFGATGASSIQIYRDGKVIGSGTGTSTYEDKDVLPDQTYQYWIVATNASGNTASEIITVKTKPLPPPQNVTITAKADTAGNVDIQFSALGATSIKLYRYELEVSSYNDSQGTYSETIQPNQTFTYWIIAFNSIGQTASQKVTVTGPAPGQVRNLRAIEKKTNAIRFAWDNDPNADKYHVKIVITKKQSASLVALGDAPTVTNDFETTETNTTVTDLSPGDNVKIDVSIINVAFGEHGNATATETVPNADVPNFEMPPVNEPFTPVDLVDSSFSLASNFWPFLLLGLCFLVAPWIYTLIVAAIRKSKVLEEDNKDDNERRQSRWSRRDMRLSLRKGE